LDTSSSTTTAGSSSTGQNSNKDGDNKKNSDNSNLFFDNLGKIFLLVIASVIASLVRSSAGTRNRNDLRDHLEDVAILDPSEIEELRLANSLLTPDVFQTILRDVYTQFPHGSCSYNDFVRCVRQTMAKMKGDAFTVELGHLIDRLMVEVLNDHNASADDTNMPLSLFFTALSMALYSDARDRIRLLYQILEMEQHQYKQEGSYSGVTIEQVRNMVGYLQETCQLPPDAQIVPTETKYPTQKWRRGTPEDLVPWADENGNPPSDRDLLDLFAFASILRSKSVCAWGECYYKRKFGEDDV
jgi:hypothetical protein